MLKHLTKHGNSLALVIDRPILDLLKIDSRTQISLTTDGRSILLTPARPASRKKALGAILEEINREYGSSLRRLAQGGAGGMKA